MILFNEIAYGPIHSRRLGLSLGLNTMPTDAKLCTFDCVYCECGFSHPCLHPKLPAVEEFKSALETKLNALKAEHLTPDVLTFSGNGEPTLHPEFLAIIKTTISLRNKYCPEAKVSVLSNSTQLYRDEVREALLMVDNRILKLDSAIDSTMQLIDRPVNKQLTVSKIVDYLKTFNGNFILQTCFLRGSYEGQTFDNTTKRELDAWYSIVEMLQPKEVMIYVIDRETPVKNLEKITRKEMEDIAEVLRRKHFKVMVTA